MNSGKVFGSPLENHIKDGSRIPLLIEKLFASIEVNGLFTEGLYRKSGAASVRRELRILIEAGGFFVLGCSHVCCLCRLCFIAAVCWQTEASIFQRCYALY